MGKETVIGINQRAKKFLEKHCKTVTTTVTTVKYYHRLNISFEFSNSKDGIEEADVLSKFPHCLENGNVKLKAYVLTDGRIVHEKIQPFIPKSTVVFTALAWENGYFITETLWTEEEMNFTLKTMTFLSPRLSGQKK